MGIYLFLHYNNVIVQCTNTFGQRKEFDRAVDKERNDHSLTPAVAVAEAATGSAIAVVFAAVVTAVAVACIGGAVVAVVGAAPVGCWCGWVWGQWGEKGQGERKEAVHRHRQWKLLLPLLPLPSVV